MGTLGPSIKYVCSDGGMGVKLKAYTYCLKRDFLLSKSIHGGGVVKKVSHLSVHTLWISCRHLRQATSSLTVSNFSLSGYKFDNDNGYSLQI